ncbi:hypothetical protein VCHA34P112_40247 [Vibrio chagasii]|nr:hypothetical protein VCHA34P112_40247 [Vibrio chagasii]CAH7306744.1 hypothetical protein VCHA43P275_60058 [Vibrio chagasii]CAH7326223.1 hypothetical protein VCHA39O224_10829 [Vibrio chagasii]
MLEQSLNELPIFGYDESTHKKTSNMLALMCREIQTGVQSRRWILPVP